VFYNNHLLLDYRSQANMGTTMYFSTPAGEQMLKTSKSKFSQGPIFAGYFRLGDAWIEKYNLGLSR